MYTFFSACRAFTIMKPDESGKRASFSADAEFLSRSLFLVVAFTLQL